MNTHSDQTQEELQIEAIRNLAKEIPINDFGMPTGIYRMDLLPFHDYDPHASTHTPQVEPMEPEAFIPLAHQADPSSDFEVGLTTGLQEESEPYIETEANNQVPAVYRIAGFPAEQLHHAFVPLQYDEGFPAFENGIPFWSRLEYEPTDAFIAFQEYLSMNRGKRATPGEYIDDEYDGIEASGSRNISELAAKLFGDDPLQIKVQRLQGYFHSYYWGLRAHAYDMCRIAQHRAQQELRSIETLDDHYVLARRLRHKLEIYMNDSEEFWDLMSPKTALDMLKTTTGLERVSAGMPVGGPPTRDVDSQGRPLEVHLRTVANTNRRPTENIISEEGAILDRALEDPESTEILQSLIIRSSG